MDVNSTSPNVETPALFTTAHRPERERERKKKHERDHRHQPLERSCVNRQGHLPFSESGRFSLTWSTARSTCSSLHTSSWTTFMRSECNSSSSFAPSPPLSCKYHKPRLWLSRFLYWAAIPQLYLQETPSEDCEAELVQVFCKGMSKTAVTTCNKHSFALHLKSRVSCKCNTHM